METYKKGTDSRTGRQYWLKTGDLTDIKMGLKAFQATQLWELMEEHQPQRFKEMLEAGTLVPFLNRETETFHEAVTYLIQEKGLSHQQAVEQQWTELCKRTGLYDL